MAREDDPQPQEWRVTFSTDESEVTVPRAAGGVDVGVMPVGEDLHFLVISDASNRAVWMHRAEQVQKVTRCVEPSQS